MSRLLVLLYGLVCYVIFILAFVYLIGFVENAHIHLFGDRYFVSRGIDFGGAPASTGTALAVNLALLGLFAVQHSGMARRGFKALWTRVLVPRAVERSTYVLFTSLCLIAMFVLWRPMPGIVWAVESEALGAVLVGISLAGWGLAGLSSYLISHSELFGLQQVLQHAKGQAPSPMKFQTPLLYKLVRHPLYLGFIIAFWVTPVMTHGHLLFAAVMLGYTLVAIQLEERDLTREFGDEYTQYRGRVRGLVPLPKPRS